MALEYFNLGNGINTYINPLEGQDGQMIHGVNVVTFPAGALSKRPGYNTFLGTPDVSQINSLLYYPWQDGTTLYLYRASGSALYYSAQGTGAWTLAGNGTITNGNHVGGAILNNVLVLGDGAGSTRHTNNGTAFTNTGTAPVAQYFAEYHNRIYASDGTSGTVNYSAANNGTNWSNSGTSDSSFLQVLGEGAAGPLFKAGDRLIITKNRGGMHNWDEYSLVDMSTKYGPTMPWAIGSIDDYWLYSNQYGLFGFDGANKQLLSNPVQRQFYNRQNNGMGTSQIGATSSACGASHIWDHYFTMGTITDDFTGRKINNAILKYDYQKNTFLNWQFNDTPTAMLSYTDANNQKQLIFGNASGQVFQLSQTATSDNGNPIASDMVFLFSYAAQQQSFSQTSAATLSGMSYEKKWNWLRVFLNPGCEVNIQFAFANSLTYQHLRWSEVLNIHPNASGDYWQESDGVVEIRFPDNINNPRRSRFLFLRIYDDSDNAQYTLYGVQIDAEIQVIK